MKFTILESSEMLPQTCLKTEMYRNSVRKTVSEHKDILAADPRVDLCKHQRQNCRILELSKAENLYR